MQIDYGGAVELFERVFEEKLRSPYLHPYYVAADAKRDEELAPVFFTHTDDDGVFYYAFHLGKVVGKDLFDIQSQYGYGGPLSSTDDRRFLQRAWGAFVEWCGEHAVLAEFIRFHPLLENTNFYLGEIVPDRNIVWIDLQAPDLLASYSTRARTAIRKAQKSGLAVEWWESERFFPMFKELYREHMQALNADSYYFFSEAYIQAVVSWDQARLATCTLDGEVLAAAIFLQGPFHMEYHLSAATGKGKELSATNLLIHEAALLGKVQGCSMFNLGGGTDASPDNPLFFFKASFSALRAPFYIGKSIHLPEEYGAMKAAWEEETSRPARRVLFYR